MKKTLALALALAMVLGLAACGGGDKPQQPSTGSNPGTSANQPSTGGDAAPVANKDKPLVWFNRQPSNSSTGELDMDALNFNGDTYYVGFDANQGAELQGQMILDYITANIDTIDRNGDGIIGYVLAIGDIGHNDSIARTRGVRKALDTAVEENGAIKSDAVGVNADGKASAVKDGKLTIGGKEYTVRELALRR